MTSTKWDALSEHTAKPIIPNKSTLGYQISFPFTAAEKIALSLVITSYIFFNTSQTVKCQIPSFWQPTQPFINPFVPSANSTLPDSALYLRHTGPQPSAVFDPALPIQPLLLSAHCRSLWTVWPLHQWLEMTMRPIVEWTRGAAGLESFLGFYFMIWFDISGQTLVSGKMSVCLT